MLKIAEQRGGKEFNIKQQIKTIQNAYEKAKQDNDDERIPDYKTLSPIELATLVKPTPIKLPISEDFSDLPVTVNHGLQVFNAKKLEALNLEIGKLRQASELLNAALATWNLPASIKVPQSLLDSLMAELPPLLQRNSEIISDLMKDIQMNTAKQPTSASSTPRPPTNQK